MGIFRKMMMLVVAVSLPMLAEAEAPDVSLKDMQGKPQALSRYIGQGKWTVVVLWAHNCSICNREIAEMNFFHDAHAAKNATVLGISIDGWAQRSKARGFVDTHALDFPNLIIEPEQASIMRLGGGRFVGTPTYYIYAPNGELVGKRIGPMSQTEVEAFIGRQKSARATTSPPS